MTDRALWVVVIRDIHPFATLTKIYFENILCLSPLIAPSHDTAGPKRTQVGVRVTLGDTGTFLHSCPSNDTIITRSIDGPETTDIVIYGETNTLAYPPPLPLSPAATSSSAGTPPLSMRVARITPAPRAPRPDDPTPRQPPAHLFGTTPLADLGANKRIIPRSNTGKAKEKAEDQVLRRAREVMLHLPRSKVPANGSSKGKERRARDAVFKVPELPATARRKQGGAGMDVFGTVEPPQPQSANAKGKGKATVADREDSEIGNAIEGANKLVRVFHLARFIIPDALLGAEKAGCPSSCRCRDIPVSFRVQGYFWFRVPWGLVCTGTFFHGLMMARIELGSRNMQRSQLTTLHICAQSAEAFVEAHVKMYVVSSGGAHDTPGSRRKTSTTMDVDDAVG